MKYIANPIRVTAHRIIKLGIIRPDKDTVLHLDNGDEVLATKEMTARITPEIGDYWVRQEDGYIYLDSKNAFQHKYSPMMSMNDTYRSFLR